MKTYIIAEIGPNHNGSLALALEMVGKLIDVEVDAVKFQLTNPNELYSKDSFKADYQKERDIFKSPIEMSKRYQLTYEEHRILKDRCAEGGIDYLCSAFDMKSLKFIHEELDVRKFKIPSGEIFSLDLIEYISKINKEIILSTGMATLNEIDYSLKLLNKNFKKKITLLHCVSNYPAPLEDVNLEVMKQLYKQFGLPVGFSDHTVGNICSPLAVAMGATVIEKHVTVNKNFDGPDHKASSTIEEFEQLVKSIRLTEKIIGVSNKLFSNQEDNIRKVARKSIVSSRIIKKGNTITKEDICFKRPGTGYLPIEINNVIGKKAKIDIEMDRVIKKEDI